MSPTLNPPAVSGQLLVSFPKEHVLQLTLNRPKSLNASTPQMMDDVRKVLNWFEDEPSLWCVLEHCSSGSPFIYSFISGGWSSSLDPVAHSAPAPILRRTSLPTLHRIRATISSPCGAIQLESRRTARPAQHGRISTQQYLWVCVHFAPGVQETVHRSGQWALVRRRHRAGFKL